MINFSMADETLIRKMGDGLLRWRVVGPGLAETGTLVYKVLI